MNDLKDIQELYEMCGDESFDKERASELILSVDINKPIGYYIEDKNKVFLDGSRELDPEIWVSWDTFLKKAAQSLNHDMCVLLLDNGADPDLDDHDKSIEPVLYDLLFLVMFEDQESDELVSKQLDITRLMLEHGADPNPFVKWYDSECFFDILVFDLFNLHTGYQLKYDRRLIILVVAYGASSDYCCPQILKPFDKSNMDQYEFYFVEAGEGRYSGIITDGDGETVARI